MRIALIAHDSRKELMAQFCTAYIRILSQNELVATGVTGKVVHDNTGLPVRCLYPGGRGGAEQISSMIAGGHQHCHRRSAHPRPGTGRPCLDRTAAGPPLKSQKRILMQKYVPAPWCKARGRSFLAY